MTTRFAALPPASRYRPLLLEVRPRPGDYFAVELVATWGSIPFGDCRLSEDPYYRIYDTRIDDRKQL